MRAAQSLWDARRRRATQLLEDESPARDLLAFYVELLGIQEEVASTIAGTAWLAPALSEAGWARLDRLSVSSLDPPFAQFVVDVIEVAPDRLAEVGRMLATSRDARIELLSSYVAASDGASAGTTGDADAIRAGFFPRAFVEALVASMGPAPDAAAASAGCRCPRCHRRPQVAAIRDEAEVKGHRLLVCSLCPTWWTFTRATCAHCGEQDPEQLILHETEQFNHVRVEECRTCRRYIKSVDLRKDGKAVPIVDDIATVTLDVWAEEQGLCKVQRNILGL